MEKTAGMSQMSVIIKKVREYQFLKRVLQFIFEYLFLLTIKTFDSRPYSSKRLITGAE